MTAELHFPNINANFPHSLSQISGLYAVFISMQSLIDTQTAASIIFLLKYIRLTVPHCHNICFSKMKRKKTFLTILTELNTFL